MNASLATVVRKWNASVTKTSLQAALDHLQARGAQPVRDGIGTTAWAKDLSSNLRWLNRKLRRFDYRFSGYQLLLKPKGRGKVPREISLARIQDRIALRCMASFMRSVSSTAAAPLPQDTISRVVQALASGAYTHFLKLDIQNFYPTIDHNWLRSVLKREFVSDDIASLFMGAVSAPTVPKGMATPKHRNTRGIPQGLAISNALAELCLQHLDNEMRSENFAYFRFVDDVLVLLPTSSEALAMTSAQRLLKMAGLEVHPVGSKSKSVKGAISDGFEYLGYRFEWPRVSVRSSSVLRIEERLARAFTAYRYACVRAEARPAQLEVAKRRLAWHVDLVITGCRFDGHNVGWLAYFSQIRHQQLLHHLDNMLASKAKRFNAENVTFKSFVVAYRLLASRRRDQSGYVPDFDSWTVAQKGSLLADVFGITANTEEEVERYFDQRIRREVRDLERDVESVAYR
jgi:hypothetical protein